MNEYKTILANELTTFQESVQPWLLMCFGGVIAADTIERNHRFLEESLELVQACSGTADEAHQLVDYVFGRQVGDKAQEVGGVMVTLAALCLAQGLDMHAAGETELARIWTKVEAIRAKQAAKPKYRPLPGPSAPIPMPSMETGEHPATTPMNPFEVMVSAQFERWMQKFFAPAMQSFEELFARSLSPESCKEFKEYVDAGSPGFAELLTGDKLYPLGELLWKTIKENK